MVREVAVGTWKSGKCIVTTRIDPELTHKHQIISAVWEGSVLSNLSELMQKGCKAQRESILYNLKPVKPF